MLEAVLSIIFEQNKFFLFREIRFIVQSASLCHLKMVLFFVPFFSSALCFMLMCCSLFIIFQCKLYYALPLLLDVRFPILSAVNLHKDSEVIEIIIFMVYRHVFLDIILTSFISV